MRKKIKKSTKRIVKNPSLFDKIFGSKKDKYSKKNNVNIGVEGGVINLHSENGESLSSLHERIEEVFTIDPKDIEIYFIQ